MSCCGKDGRSLCCTAMSNIHLPPIDGAVYDLTMKYGCLIRERVRKFYLGSLAPEIFIFGRLTVAALNRLYILFQCCFVYNIQ
jgi:hypothetical protein